MCLCAIWINSGFVKGFKSNLPYSIDTQIRTHNNFVKEDRRNKFTGWEAVISNMTRITCIHTNRWIMYTSVLFKCDRWCHLLLLTMKKFEISTRESQIGPRGQDSSSWSCENGRWSQEIGAWGLLRSRAFKRDGKLQ